MMALLEIRNVSASYGHSKVLDDVSLKVGGGQVTTLLGANGAGKTTMLRAICNMMVRSSGQIVFDGSVSVSGYRIVARLGVAHVPDGRGTFTISPWRKTFGSAPTFVGTATSQRRSRADLRLFPAT